VFQASLAVIYVTDMERALRFYRDALGARVGFTWPEQGATPDYAVLEIGDTRFGIGTYTVMHDLTGDLPLGGGGPQFELTLKTDDANAAVARLVAHGAQVVSPVEDRPWRERAAWLRAPEGHLIQVYAPLDGGG
jgi:catechol 2,3-dioxygenase-like lactoylglutathione lyase family enzyme